MLNVFRSSLQSTSVKAMLVLLALTFILWGVGDVLKGGNGEPYVLKVGDQEFTQAMWKDTLSKQAHHLSQTYGQHISPEDLKESGFYSNLLDQIINKMILSQEAKKLGILVSNEMVKYDIASHPNFQDGTGRFNKEIFDNTLRNMGISEETMIKTLKEDIAVSNLVRPFMSFNLPSPQFIEQINIIANSEREIELYELESNKITLTKQPSKEELEKIFNKHENEFMVPEMRELSYFTFNIKNIDQEVDITNKELEAQYKNKIFLFTQPEKRTISQLIFKDMDIALEAKEAVEKGEALSTVGKNMKAINRETSIGTLTKEGFDREIGETIFSTPKGNVSMPVQSPMGVHLFVIDDIIPQRVLSFEEAKESLKNQLTEEKLFERLSSLAQEMDNEIINNKSIEEIAENYKFKLIHTKLIEYNSKFVKGLEGSNAFKTTAFSTDLNNTSMVTPYEDSVFFVIRTDKIHPKQHKAKEAITHELIKLWNQEQKDFLIEQSAQKLSETLRTKEPIPSDIKKLITLKKLKLSRNNTESLPNILLDQIYQTQLGRSTTAYKVDDKYLIAKIVKVNKPDKHVINKHKFETQAMYAQTQQDIFIKEYINSVKHKYNIKINNEILD